MLAALLLCGLVIACAQGSLTVIASRPTTSTLRSDAQASSWVRWCTRGHPRQDRRRLAFCARVNGRVLAVTHGPAAGEAHAAVISDFHIVIVRLPDDALAPSRGARILAIGPLFRARDGQREVQAFRLAPA